MFGESDFSFMNRALGLAGHALFTTAPNPRVGCVLVRDNMILGEGWTQPPGSNHAEIEAIQDARANGHDLHGATAYVTLEPCSHFGRTPPCTQALIDAHISRVIAAMEDPNPLVSGAGLEALRVAGLDVRCGLLEREAREINPGFVSRMTRGVPWVRIKIASSLDGKTALSDGKSQWITGKDARADTHWWRARSCAVLTGIGTVLADDPLLTVRHVEIPRQPWRVVVDSRFEVPETARLFDGNPVLIATARADAAKADRLAEKHAQVLVLPDETQEKVDLMALMRELAARSVNEVHVEAGPRLNGALLQSGCADELLIYFAPKLLGPGSGLCDLPAIDELSDARSLVFGNVSQVGDDLRVQAYFSSHL